MDIVFVEPPFKSTIQEVLGTAGPLLGFGSMCHQLEKQGHTVEIFDCPTLGLDLHTVAKVVETLRPDMVGISSTTPSFNDACKLAKAVKEGNPHCIIVMGGPHVSFEDYAALQKPYVDVVVRGEGEATISDLATSLETGEPLKNVLGITYKEDGVIRRNPDRPFIQDLDRLSVSYHKLPMSRYTLKGTNYATIMSSRGCPYGCIFCASSRLHGKPWRSKSAERVVQEVQHLKDTYRVKHIEFLDDLFTFNTKRVKDICTRLIQEKVDIQWFCSSRVDTISKKLMATMKKAGCSGLYMGIESGCQRVLNILRKGITIQQIEAAFAWAKEVNIETVGTFILGTPGETPRDIRQTIRFAKKVNPDYAQFTFCTPYPGTALYHYAKNNNLLLTRDWSRYTTMEPVLKVPDVSTTELQKLFKEAYRRFLPSALFKLITKKKIGFAGKILFKALKTL